MKKLLYQTLCSIFFGLLLLIIGLGLGELFDFEVTDFAQGYLLAAGHYIGADVYRNVKIHIDWE